MIRTAEGARSFGYDTLGPVFHRYLLKLRIAQMAMESEDVCTLFVARGGLRLRSFYETIYCGPDSVGGAIRMGDLFVSRIAVLKVALANQSAYAIGKLAELLKAKSCADALLVLTSPAVFRQWHADLTDEQALEYASEKVNEQFLLSVQVASQQQGGVLQEYFALQKSLLVEHFAAASGGASKVLLVDTGWSGSIVAGLQEVFPDTEIVSTFFGKFSYFGRVTGPYMRDIVGLELEGDGYLPWKATTAMLLNRHLIEAVCEVNFPSISTYQADEDGNLVFDQSVNDPRLRVPGEGEYMALGIQDYLVENGSQSTEIVVQRAVRAYHTLHWFSLFPNRRMTELGNFSRSVDMGQTGYVPMLITSEKDNALGTKIRNLRRSLWVPGQIALEFSWARYPLQFAYACYSFLKTIRLRLG